MDVGELATPGPLEALGGLYALDRIERDHREVRTVTRLCREGRLMAEDLVEAFAISDQLLGAPIALG